MSVWWLSREGLSWCADVSIGSMEVTMSDESDSTALGPYNNMPLAPEATPKLPSGQGSPRPQPQPTIKTKLPPVKTKTPVKRIRPNMGGRR